MIATKKDIKRLEKQLQYVESTLRVILEWKSKAPCGSCGIDEGVRKHVSAFIDFLGYELNQREEPQPLFRKKAKNA